MCRKVITADGQELETVKQLRTILSDEDIVLEVLSRHDKVFWDWLTNAIYDYEDRVKLPANRRGKL